MGGGKTQSPTVTTTNQYRTAVCMGYAVKRDVKLELEIEMESDTDYCPLSLRLRRIGQFGDCLLTEYRIQGTITCDCTVQMRRLLSCRPMCNDHAS